MKIAHRVSLSNRMLAFLTARVDNDGYNVTLGTKSSCWASHIAPDCALTDIWNVDTQFCEGKHDLKAFRAEFDLLIKEWGSDYRIELLINADKEDLPTHCLVVDVKIGQGFEIDGEEGQGKYSVRRQWERVKIVGQKDNLLNEKVPAKVTYGFIDDGSMELFDLKTVVRPHFCDRNNCSSVGLKLSTPKEAEKCARQHEEYCKVSSAMEQRVIDAIIGDCHVAYSAYKTVDDVPVNNLDEVAIQGKAVLVDFGGGLDEGYNDEEYESEVVEDVTWLQLCVLFNESVKVTKDFHHHFLEGVYLDKKASRADNIAVYHFCTGS